MVVSNWIASLRFTSLRLAMFREVRVLLEL